VAAIITHSPPCSPTTEGAVELLLDALRAHLGHASSHAPAQAARDNPGGTAREAFTAPLLHVLLAEGKAPLPASFSLSERQDLRAIYYANAARKAALLQLLEEVTDAFTAAGIPFLVLKGGALETALELPPALRVMADLDLLLREQDLADAEEILRQVGLTPTRDAANAALLRARGYHLVPYAAASGAAVELHRELLPRTVPFHLPAAALWEAGLTVPWRGRALRVPSPEHLYLHTAIHYGFWHTRGAAIRRLWDLALIAERLPLDEARLETEARRCGALRLLGSARWELQALRTRDPATWPELCRRIRLSDELWTPLSPIERLRARATLLDGPWQQLALLRSAVLPAQEETANATGCRTAAQHLAHFLHPHRLWRGARAGVRAFRRSGVRGRKERPVLHGEHK